MHETIISNVLERMDGTLTKEQKTLLEASLIVALKDTVIVSNNRKHADWEWYIERYCQQKRMIGCAESSLKQYLLTLNELRRMTKKTPEQITSGDVRAFLLQVEPHVSKVTLNNKLRNLSSFFEWMCDEELIFRNPCKGIPAIRVTRKVKKAFTGEDLEKLREGADNLRDKALQYFLDSTGCRISEAVSVNRDDIDFDTRSLIIYGSKGKAEREVLFTEECAYHLRMYLQSRTDDCEALFVTRLSPHRRLAAAGAQKALKEIGKRVGVKANAHRFRRTMITRCNRRGMPMGEIQRLAGHANPQTTQIYIDMDSRTVRSSYQRLS